MSFAEQERALFDLLFNPELRQKFADNISKALSDYDLEPDEIEDFSVIRPDALDMDARMRRGMVLSQVCRAFPITFSIASSLGDGLALLRAQLDNHIMFQAPIDWASAFGSRLRETLSKVDFKSPSEKSAVLAILEFELGMAWTAAALKREMLEKGEIEEISPSLDENWTSKPLSMASFVSAALIPVSYKKLKKPLCPVSDTELWRHLGRSPTPASRVTALLRKADPRLLVARVELVHKSHCEPTVVHKTVELSEGFAPLLQNVNGKLSVDDILVYLKQAGGNDQILSGVKSGFSMLCKNGMIHTA